MAGAGLDGHVYVWNVESGTRVHDFPTTTRSGGVSLALSADGSDCFAGTYYAWGVACVDLSERRELWRRTDLKRFYGLEFVPYDGTLVGWFDGRAGQVLEGRTGKSIERYPALGAFCASRFDRSVLRYGKQLELINALGERQRLSRESFALLAAGFSSDSCVVSEVGGAVRAFELETGHLTWTYQPSPGIHVTQLDFAPRVCRFVAIEYAYTTAARETSPIVSLLHLEPGGKVVFRRAVREWPQAVFAGNGDFLLNGLGELHDVDTGDVVHVFTDFPR